LHEVRNNERRLKKKLRKIIQQTGIKKSLTTGKVKSAAPKENELLDTPVITDKVSWQMMESPGSREGKVKLSPKMESARKRGRKQGTKRKMGSPGQRGRKGRVRTKMESSGKRGSKVETGVHEGNGARPGHGKSTQHGVGNSGSGCTQKCVYKHVYSRVYSTVQYCIPNVGNERHRRTTTRLGEHSILLIDSALCLGRVKKIGAKRLIINGIRVKRWITLRTTGKGGIKGFKGKKIPGQLIWHSKQKRKSWLKKKVLQETWLDLNKLGNGIKVGGKYDNYILCERDIGSGQSGKINVVNNPDKQYEKMSNAQASGIASKSGGGGGGDGDGGRGIPMDLDPFPSLGTKMGSKKGIIEMSKMYQRFCVFECMYYRYLWFMNNIGNPGYRHYRE